MDLNLDNLFSAGDKPKVPTMRISNGVMALVKGLEAFVGKPEESEDGYAIGGYTWIPAYDEVAKWMASTNGKGLLLIGANGTGKTTIEQILKKIIDRYFNTETDIVNRCRMTSANDMKEVWDRYCRYQIIDDIGKESVFSNYGERHDYFSEILDRAERMGQLLICSTNLDGKKLIEKYGVRSMDRMNHLLHAVKFEGDSFRK